MKKIQFIFTLVLCMVFASANAQTWNFTSMTEADKTLCSNDANWLLGTDRYCYTKELNNEVLTASGTELAYTKGLKFTASAPASIAEGKAKIRLNYGSNRLELNGANVTMTIPGLKAGQKITVVCKTAKSGEARGINATNLTAVSGYFNSTSTDDQTNVGTVTADGDVVLTTSAGMYVSSVSVTENGGSDTNPDTPSTSNDVPMNLSKNQMRVTLTSNDIKYYNTENVSAVDIDGNNVTVTPASGAESDNYKGNVSRIAFAKAQEDGKGGDIDNPTGAVQITESKGWLESVYAKWAAYAGAESYNVYCNGNKIDQQLIRQYPTYIRADVPGLAAGTYTLKVVAVDGNGNEISGSASTVSNLEVRNFNREGFAHKTQKTGVGAYNNDGTLKTGAKVIYVTAATAKTIKTTVKTSSSKSEEFTGLQNILAAYEKCQDQTPIAFRIIGKVSLEDLDGIKSSSEGLQIKGKGYSEFNITLEGIGDDATVYGFGFLVRNVNSLEFRNFAIMECLDDALSLDTQNSNVWIHNMDFFYGQAGGAADQKKGDGTVDIKGKSKDITVAYNRFWDNGKSSLCGMKSETTECDITYHHNWFDHSDSRHARVRTMSVHLYNNYFQHCDVYGVGSTMASSLLVDHNYFDAVTRPMMIAGQGTDMKTASSSSGTFSGENGGIIKSCANVFANKPTSFSYITWKENNTSFDAYEVSDLSEKVPSTVVTLKGGTSHNNFDTDASRMYEFTPDAAEDVPAIVTGYYGAGRMNHGDIDFVLTDEVYKEGDHHVRHPKLDNILVNYKSQLVKVYGE